MSKKAHVFLWVFNKSSTFAGRNDEYQNIASMDLIGRETEKELLKEYIHSGKPEFVALYGRRRIGKTFLIDEFFDRQYAFSAIGVIDGNRTEQMTAFVQSLRGIGYQGRFPKTWMEAFDVLAQLLEPTLKRNRRCVIFIDELPCFDTPKAGFINAFGHFWNTWAQKHRQVMLVVCGSATTWMLKNIIDSHGGLHNRITHEIHLHPFSLYETERMLHSMGIAWDRLSILQAYMCMGGVPYYLSLLRKGESLSQAIDRLFFSGNAPLRFEFDRLFSSLFRDPAPYMDIIRVLSACKQGITREQTITALGKQANGHLSDYLANLQKCDFVRYYFVKSRKVKKTNGLYQLTDFFTIFHNTFLTMPINDEHYWSHNLQSATMKTWIGLAFERVCMAHIPQIKYALGIDRIGTEYYSWRSRVAENGAQINLLIERADRIINLCEIKYSEQPYILTKAEDLKLRNRQACFISETGTTKAVFPTLISTYGLHQNMYSGGIQAEITIDDLFLPVKNR